MNEERCVCCDNPIPEGTMVCWNCEHNILDNHNTLTQADLEIVKPYNSKIGQIFAKIINGLYRLIDTLKRYRIDCTK